MAPASDHPTALLRNTTGQRVGHRGVLALYAVALLIMAGAAVLWRSASSPPPITGTDAVQEHFRRGAELARTGDTKGAEEAYLTAIALDPGFAPAHFAIADLYDSAGRPVIAAEKLKALLAANPHAQHVLCRQSELYLKAGGFEKGVITGRAELRNDPHCPLAHCVVGMALMLAGDRMAAVDHLREAHSAAPHDVRITRTFVQILGQAGRVSEAKTLAEGLLRAEPESPQAEYLNGWLLARTAGKDANARQAAQQHLTRALALDDTYAEASGALGGLLANMGLAEMALPLLEKARDGGSYDIETATALAAASAQLRRPNAPQAAARAHEMAVFEEQLRRRRASWLARPDDIPNTLALARLERDRGDRPDARDLVIGILKTDPNQPDALNLLENLVARR